MTRWRRWWQPSGNTPAVLTGIRALISARESKSDCFCSLDAVTELLVHLVVGPSSLPDEERRHTNLLWYPVDFSFKECAFPGFHVCSGDFKDTGCNIGCSSSDVNHFPACAPFVHPPEEEVFTV